MTQFHPRINDYGQPVEIRHPSVASPLANWSTPTATATVVPDGPMPAELNGIALAPWQPPVSDQGWAAVEGQAELDEPPMPKSSLPPASGVVTVEPDGRIWMVSPTNKFGGYETTFPKGKRDDKNLGLQANAIKEGFEESGLKVRITGYLGDFNRTTSITRLYLEDARRKLTI